MSIFIIGIGTNLLHYTTGESAMSHAYSFFLFTLFLLLTIKWHQKPIIHWNSMTKQAYWAAFGKTEKPENYQELLRSPDLEKAIKGGKEY